MLALTASCSRHASITMTFSNGQAGSLERGLMTMSSRLDDRPRISMDEQARLPIRMKPCTHCASVTTDGH